MPLKVNGATIPYSLVVPIAVFTAWLGGLSYQVNANAEELDKKADTSERLAKIEVVQEYTKKEVKEIKEEQKEQGKILDKILEAVKK